MISSINRPTLARPGSDAKKVLKILLSCFVLIKSLNARAHLKILTNMTRILLSLNVGEMKTTEPILITKSKMLYPSLK